MLPWKSAGWPGEADKAIPASGHPRTKSIPIIAMAANVLMKGILTSKSAGMDTYIAKPLDLVRLYQALVEKMAPIG